MTIPRGCRRWIMVLGILAAACGGDASRKRTLESIRGMLTPPPPPPDTIPEMLEYHPDLVVNIDEMRKLPAGVLYLDSVAGEGPEAVPGDQVDLRLAGWLPDGSPIDSTSISVRLGAGELIRGIDLGVQGMKAGGRRKLVIPPGLAYGEEGREDVPPFSVVVYEVELVGIRP